MKHLIKASLKHLKNPEVASKESEIKDLEKQLDKALKEFDVELKAYNDKHQKAFNINVSMSKPEFNKLLTEAKEHQDKAIQARNRINSIKSGLAERRGK